jgi:hypothetical protein
MFLDKRITWRNFYFLHEPGADVRCADLVAKVSKLQIRIHNVLEASRRWIII